MNLEKKELASRLGVRSETYYRWEAGDQRMGKTADRLVRALVALELGAQDYARDMIDVALEEPQGWHAEVERGDEQWRPRAAG